MEIYVKPAPGRRVRVPARAYAVLPPDGDSLPRDAWLIRRLAAGDLVEATTPHREPAATPAPTPKK